MSLSEEELSRRRARYKTDDDWNARWPRWDEMDDTGQGIVIVFTLGWVPVILVALARLFDWLSSF